MSSEIFELKDEIGEGGLDAIVQAERDYVWLHSSDEVSSYVTVIFFTAQSLTLCYLQYSAIRKMKQQAKGESNDGERETREETKGMGKRIPKSWRRRQ